MDKTGELTALQKKKLLVEKRKKELAERQSKNQQEGSAKKPQEDSQTNIGSSQRLQEDQEQQQQQQQQKQEEQQQEKKKVNLSFNSMVFDIQIDHKEIDTIDFQIQCNLGSSVDSNAQLKKSSNKKGSFVQDSEEDDDQVLPAIHKDNRGRNESLNVIHQPSLLRGAEEQEKAPLELTQEDIDQITKSPEFNQFFKKSSKLIEKAIQQKEVELLEDKFQEEVENVVENENDPLIHEHKFFDQQYCANRVVTTVQWSPNLPEVFLAAYSENDEGNINDHVGVLLLWSTQLKSRPEFHCFCQSQITTACFYPYNNNLIIGGCYNGQIVIWDLREKSMPVQRSSQDGHAYPIYSLNVVGTKNAHNIVSISNDGTLCTWKINNLNQPQEKLFITDQKKQEQNITVMDFKKDESNNFFIGIENGQMHSAQLHSSDKQQLIQKTYTGHQAPISAISQNNISTEDNNQFMQNLVLTSSFDWTVKLWNPSQSEECLYTFEHSEDYVYDVQWNRANPCIFATADGDGYIDIWDLQGDFELPAGRHLCEAKNSINKISWSNGGDKLLAGDSKGNIDLYQMRKKFLKFESSKFSEIEQLLKAEN